jgi:hypothetical protein
LVCLGKPLFLKAYPAEMHLSCVIFPLLKECITKKQMLKINGL